MKNKIIILFCMILLVTTFASAFDLDNTKQVNSIYDITIKNSFGFGSELINVKLVNYTGHCIAGECYAYYLVNNYGEENPLRSSVYYSESLKYEINDRQRKYEYYDNNFLRYEPIYKSECSKQATINGTQDVCSQIKIGEKEVYGGWVDYSSIKETKGEYLIREKIDIEEGETIDVVPNFYGVDLFEWAPFTGYIRYEFQLVLDDNSTISSTQWRAMNLTIGTTGPNEPFNFRGLSLHLAESEATGDLNISLSSVDAGGNPKLDNLSTGRLTTTEVTGGDWYNVTMSDAELTADTRYAIVLKGASGGWKWSQKNTGNYTGGGGISSASSGSTWTNAGAPNADFAFQMWGGGGYLMEILSTLNSPTNNSNIPENYQSFNGAFIITYGNLTNTTLEVYNPSGSLFRSNFTTISGASNTSSLDISGFTNSNTYLWNYYSCGINTTTTVCSYATSNYSFTPNSFNFGLCNSTLTKPYINFTFQDEGDLSSINASITTSTFEYWASSQTLSKTLTFVNTSDNPSYAFCLDNNYSTLYVNPYVQYKQGSSYPQRIYDPSTLTLTNSTTNKILYLLGSSDGIYSAFQLVDAVNRPLSGVLATGVREISGEDVIIGTGTTDAAGSVTFWVNPDFSHTFTFSKDGYGSVSYSIIPTQSSYTVTMGTNSSAYVSTSNFSGLKWYAFPSSGLINNSYLRDYGFNITARDSNLVKCRIDLLNLDRTITLATASANSTLSGARCDVLVSHSINSTYPTIKGRLLVDVGSGWMQLEDDITWRYENVSTTGLTFMDSFNSLKSFDLRYFNNNENHREYTQILLFFLIATIICAVLNYAGWDIQTRGGMVYLMGMFIWIASIPGFLNFEGFTSWDIINKYYLAGLYSCFMIGWGFRQFT